MVPRRSRMETEKQQTTGLEVDHHAETLEQMFFDAPPSVRRPSTTPPPPVVVLGEFLGDPVADAWLR